jgi:hypothetical protein
MEDWRWVFPGKALFFAHHRADIAQFLRGGYYLDYERLTRLWFAVRRDRLAKNNTSVHAAVPFSLSQKSRIIFFKDMTLP